jgi:hypothetical protein
MKTCGMMGEVVGKAASICVKNDCLPYAVYERYWKEMDSLLQLPGKAFRKTVQEEFTIPADALPLAGSFGPPTGIDPTKLPGVVIDNKQAISTGNWTSGEGLKGFIGYDYVYAAAKSGATIRFEWKAEKAGSVELRLAYQPHENRGNSVPVAIQVGSTKSNVRINMQAKPAIDGTFVTLGEFSAKAGDVVSVTLSTENAGGNVHADALQILPR